MKHSDQDTTVSHFGIKPITKTPMNLLTPEKTPRKQCYIAGPMRGIRKFNFPAFEEVQLPGLRRGS
jgi:hypothetical protein